MFKSINLSIAFILWAGFFSIGVIASDSTVNYVANSNNPIQIMFDLAYKELNEGKFENAVKLFSALEKSSPTPRIKLELARALFLTKNYEQAKVIFEDVLINNNVSWSVRENIHYYLDEIDLRLGSIKFSFAIVNDSNPLNFTSNEEITIGGQKLTIVKPQKAESATAVKVGLNAAKSFTENNDLIGFLNSTFLNYEESEINRIDIDAGFIYTLTDNQRHKIKTGIEESFYGGDHQFDFPYIGYIYIPDASNEFKLNTEFKYGQLDVKDADQYDSDYFSAKLNAKRFLKQGYLLSSIFLIEKSLSNEKAYSYDGYSINLDLSVPILKKWGADFFINYSGRNYQDKDPIFGIVREDTKKSFGLSVSNKMLRFYDLIPEVGLMYEKNDSTLDYFEYDKLSIIFKISQ